MLRNRQRRLVLFTFACAVVFARPVRPADSGPAAKAQAPSQTAQTKVLGRLIKLDAREPSDTPDAESKQAAAERSGPGSAIARRTTVRAVVAPNLLANTKQSRTVAKTAKSGGTSERADSPAGQSSLATQPPQTEPRPATIKLARKLNVATPAPKQQHPSGSRSASSRRKQRPGPVTTAEKKQPAGAETNPAADDKLEPQQAAARPPSQATRQLARMLDMTAPARTKSGSVETSKQGPSRSEPSRESQQKPANKKPESNSVKLGSENSSAISKPRKPATIVGRPAKLNLAHMFEWKAPETKRIAILISDQNTRPSKPVQQSKADRPPAARPAKIAAAKRGTGADAADGLPIAKSAQDHPATVVPQDKAGVELRRESTLHLGRMFGWQNPARQQTPGIVASDQRTRRLPRTPQVQPESATADRQASRTEPTRPVPAKIRPARELAFGPNQVPGFNTAAHSRESQTSMPARTSPRPRPDSASLATNQQVQLEARPESTEKRSAEATSKGTAHPQFAGKRPVEHGPASTNPMSHLGPTPVPQVAMAAKDSHPAAQPQPAPSVIPPQHGNGEPSRVFETSVPWMPSGDPLLSGVVNNDLDALRVAPPAMPQRMVGDGVALAPRSISGSWSNQPLVAHANNHQPVQLFSHAQQVQTSGHSWPCSNCGLNYCCCADIKWQVSADVLLLHRSGPGRPDNTIISSAGAPADELSVDVHGGPRLTVVRNNLCEGINLESTYYLVDQWSGANTINGTLNLFNVNIGLGSAVQRYESRLQNAEVNLYKSRTNWTDFLVGVRWLQLQDSASVSGNSVLLPNFNRSVDTENNLFGGQIGLRRFWWDEGGFFTLQTTIKGGVYYNQIDRETNPLAPVQLSGDSTSFIGEIELGANFELTRRWSLDMGYQAIWITGIAEANNQFFSPTRIADDEQLAIHGLRLGITRSW